MLLLRTLVRVCPVTQIEAPFAFFHNPEELREISSCAYPNSFPTWPPSSPDPCDLSDYCSVIDFRPYGNRPQRIFRHINTKRTENHPHYIGTYNLISYSKISFENLHVVWLVKKFSTSYVILRFITVFTKSSHRFLF
jgi:hypothetical protein